MSPNQYRAVNHEKFEFNERNQDWLISWHPPGTLPSGTRHGSAGICFTPEQSVVLVSADNGHTWELPGGRPEGQESLRETLEREVLEEACAEVIGAELVGFVLGECIKGAEAGLTIVRAAWSASIELLPWLPQHEMTCRRLVNPSSLMDEISIGTGARPVYERWLFESLEGTQDGRSQVHP